MRKKQSIVDIIGKKRLFFDGGTGTVFEKWGLAAGVGPEAFSLERPELVERLHREYIEAGADIIKTNTFGVNCLKYENYTEYIEAAILAAKRATCGCDDKFIAFDIGPTGKMLEPLGDLCFEEAVEVFAKNVRAAVSVGVDLILIETMNDSYETKAAVLAAKENSDLPIFVTNVYDESGKLMTGASPEAMVAMLEGLGVCALGANCSLGPDKMLPIVKRLIDSASVPVIVNPNAGLPSVINGESVFSIFPDEFCAYMKQMAFLGASVLGGCCGTTPEYIRSVRGACADIPVLPIEKKKKTVVSSYTHALEIGGEPLLVGERINPTGKPKLKEALRSGNITYILEEAVRQAEAGAHALDVNVGLPEINEPEVMVQLVKEIQSVTDLPLQIDSGNPAALEGAMRVYNGKPLVNSVNGKRESLERVLPLVKKYGGVLIALTMDEAGIPSDVEGRLRIAQRILDAAQKHGIKREDIIFDPLAMAVSADKNAAIVTLDTVKALNNMGCRTSLGVSNVSFGLPSRDKINSVYFSLALAAGLDVAIMNPHSETMMSVYYAHKALTGRDEGFEAYIDFAKPSVAEKPEGSNFPFEGETPQALRRAIVRGLRAEAERLAEIEAESRSPLDIINCDVVAALEDVGCDFEEGRVYLPGLLMSAEAATAAFSVLKKRLPQVKGGGGAPIILATVKGDIHDIGKNIVKVLLESYGFEVCDLGRDVAPQSIVEAAERCGARLVGLSALMTTTVPAMEETVRLIKERLPRCTVMVGGAVLTLEYSKSMGADYYAKDAMGAVRIAKEVYK